MDARIFLFVAVVCASAPGAANAQPPAPGAPDSTNPPPITGGQFLPPYYTVPPAGPFVGGPGVWYPPPATSSIGVYVFGASRGFWSNGMSLYGPPVPVPGPIPGSFGNLPGAPYPGVPFPGPVGYGYGLGVYAPLHRYRVSSAASRLPVVEDLHPGPATPLAPPAKSGGSVILSLKVPQPAADVFVNGLPTRLSGTDRIYKTPPVEAGRSCTFTVKARWLEHGQEVEMTQTVSGMPGEVVRVIFDSPGTIIRR